MKKIISILLTVLILTGVFATVMPLSVTAHPVIARKADPSTLDGWKNFFGENIQNTGFSGTVWSDKTVLTDPSVLGNNIELSEADNFTVVLSAIASDTLVTGYSNEPSDTVFVIDASSQNKELDQLVSALNKSISSIQNINNHNRIGVVSYSGNYDSATPAQLTDSKVLLPIGRYTHSDGEFFVKKASDISGVDALCVNKGVKNEASTELPCEAASVYGASYIQSGIYTAMNQFLSVEDTVIPNSEIQAGTKRMPVMILISSGVPNVGTSDYSNVGSSNMGDGSETVNELASAIPFVTQLTLSYAKERVSEHYDNSAVLYTLSLDDGDHPVVDPTTSSTNINKHWNTYNQTANGTSMQLGIGRSWINEGAYWQTNYVSISKNSYELKKQYVNDYFRADISVDAAFSRVVNELKAQSQHYPTYIEGEDHDLGGYIEFIDDIGQYMAVKQINGIKLGGVLYTGEEIAKNFRPGGGDLGTIDAPNELGKELIGSVMERLGIDDLIRARDLITRAYRAKQLYYDSATGEYSNYIGWYADAEGKFISHGAEGDKAIPENAVFYNRSYGFTGVVADGYKATDMMYVSVQVHTRIETGTSAVIFRVPAALIPVITYNVSMTGESLEEPGAVYLSYDDVMEVDTDGDGLYDSGLPMGPIRLVYEVGLKTEINEITVHELVSDSYKYVNDGKYTFYTNRWNPDDLDHEHPSVAENTVAFFSPSEDNRRYYYTENTPVYEKVGGEYLRYMGESINSSGEFYRAFNVFEYNEDVSEGNAIVHIHYEAIAEKSLEKAKRNTDGSWYIPKGTVHRYYEEYSHSKSENTTGTLEYSHYPKVEKTEDESSYYVDFILGNNGYVTIEAARGIKITQQGDQTMSGYNGNYSYRISGKDGSYRLYINHGPNRHTKLQLDIIDGKGTVNLKEGEKAYILDLPVGETFNVKSLTEGCDFEVSSVNSKQGDAVDIKITDWKISDAAFVNTLVPPKGSASFMVRPLIEHPFDSGVNTDNVDFEYKADFYDDSGNNIRSESFILKDTEFRRFDDIPLKTKIVITQTLVPEGFTTDKQDNKYEITVDEERIYTTTFVNTYSPVPVKNVNVTVTGNKSFTGRAEDAWLQGDVFTFMIQKRVGTSWVDMGTDSVSSPGERFDFSELMKAECYDAPGAYSYRIFEVYSDNPYQGVTYDKNIAWFDVLVSDENWDGEYEIENVVGFNGIMVGKSGGKFNAHASFVGSYGVAGTDYVSIFVNAKVEDRSGSLAPKTPAGLNFGLYQGDSLVQVLPTTSAAGESIITLNFGSLNVGKNIEYTLKQIVPDEAENGMEYSNKEYPITITLYDDTMGGVYALVSSEGRRGEQLTFDFTNIYDPEDFNWSAVGNVSLEGADITDERFEFVLCKADSSFTQLTEVKRVKNTGNDIVFTPVTFDSVGRYCYVIMQIKGDEEGITYDEAAYEVIIDVEDVDGALVGKITSAEEFKFTNTYKKAQGSNNTVVKPNKNNTASKPSTSPQTEDRANFTLWFIMLALSGAGIVALILTSERLRAKNRR